MSAAIYCHICDSYACVRDHSIAKKQTTGPPKIKYHRWVTPVPVDIDVIKNEDGKLIGRMPVYIQLAGNSALIDVDDIFCYTCRKTLQEAWGEECR